MKRVTFTKFAFLAFFVSILLVGIASALTITAPADLTQTKTQSTFTVTNDQNYTQSISISPATVVLGDSTNSVTLTLSPTSISSLANGTTSSPITITASNFVGTLPFGRYSTTITATGTAPGQNATNVTTQAVFYKGFCTNGPVGTNLSVTEVDISSNGDEDTTWMPLDTVKVKVSFENKASDKVKSVIVELGIFDSSGKKKTGEFTFINSDEEKIKYGSLDEGDDDDVTFEFEVPADIKEGDYTVVAKAYSDSDGQTNTCSERIGDAVSIEKQSDSGKYIAFDNVLVSPTEAVCGDTVTLSFTAYNVGDEDQDRVKINTNSKEMNVSQYSEITGGLDMGDSVDNTVTFIVPAGLADKTYNILLDAEYDYNKGIYRDGSDSDYVVPLKVFGCTPVVTKLMTLTAEMVSEEAVAGSPLEIKTTITNPGTSTMTYDVSAKNYGSWADSVKASDDTITLNAGQSKDVTFTFQVSKEAEGEQSFDVQVSSNGKTESKEVVVDITKPSTGLSSLFAGKSTTFWIIIAANVILIILIIVVAVRLASK